MSVPNDIVREADAFDYIVWPTDGEAIPSDDVVVLFGRHAGGAAPPDVNKQQTDHPRNGS